MLLLPLHQLVSAGRGLWRIFYKGQASALLSSGLSLPVHRNPKEAKKWYDLSQVIWTGPYLAPAPRGWCFCNQSTLFDQCLWTSVSLAALSAMAINEVMSMLRFTVYIFCDVSAVISWCPPTLHFTAKKPAMLNNFNDISWETSVEGVTNPKPVEINAWKSLVSSGLWIRLRFVIITYCRLS